MSEPSSRKRQSAQPQLYGFNELDEFRANRPFHGHDHAGTRYAMVITINLGLLRSASNMPDFSKDPV